MPAQSEQDSSTFRAKNNINDSEKSVKKSYRPHENIRYSLRETDDNIQNALAAEEKAMMQGETLQKTNNDYDRQEVVASRIAHAIDPQGIQCKRKL